MYLGVREGNRVSYSTSGESTLQGVYIREFLQLESAHFIQNKKEEILSCSCCVTLRVPPVTLMLHPLDSEMGWSGELWPKTNLLNWPK